MKKKKPLTKMEKKRSKDNRGQRPRSRGAAGGVAPKGNSEMRLVVLATNHRKRRGNRGRIAASGIQEKNEGPLQTWRSGRSSKKDEKNRGEGKTTKLNQDLQDCGRKESIEGKEVPFQAASDRRKKKKAT